MAFSSSNQSHTTQNEAPRYFMVSATSEIVKWFVACEICILQCREFMNVWQWTVSPRWQWQSPSNVCKVVDCIFSPRTISYADQLEIATPCTHYPSILYKRQESVRSFNSNINSDVLVCFTSALSNLGFTYIKRLKFFEKHESLE